jgi:hypothetical protein
MFEVIEDVMYDWHCPVSHYKFMHSMKKISFIHNISVILQKLRIQSVFIIRELDRFRRVMVKTTVLFCHNRGGRFLNFWIFFFFLLACILTILNHLSQNSINKLGRFQTRSGSMVCGITLPTLFAWFGTQGALHGGFKPLLYLFPN